jgi:hypothetical protein
VIDNKAQVLVRLKFFRFVASLVVRSIKVRLNCNKVPYSIINGDLLPILYLYFGYVFVYTLCIKVI